MKLKRCVMIGVGLIGGSMGKALIERGLASEVIGLCRRAGSLENALAEGSITSGHVNDYENALVGADMVVIATPVRTIRSVLSSVAASGGVSPEVPVTDVGSTKREVMEWAAAHKDVSFVGGHPIAGSEKKGVNFSSGDLFEGSRCVLCTGDSTREGHLEIVESMWRALGAEVSVMTPREHDRVLAFTSHLPHAVACALAGSQEVSFKDLASTGFADTTRLAASDPALWKDIFLSNADNILRSLGRFRDELNELESALDRGDKEELLGWLEKCKKVRDAFDG